MPRFFVIFEAGADTQRLAAAVRTHPRQTVFEMYSITYMMKDDGMLVADTLLDERYAAQAIRTFLAAYDLKALSIQKDVA